jgi:phosphate transport system permease protein
MRTLAANIAVEIPESEVDSTHYRILFLAALVLFLFTFAVNTIAEVVRQQLRGKYSTI